MNKQIDERIADCFFEHEIMNGFDVSYSIHAAVDKKTATAALALGIGKDIIDHYTYFDGLNYSWTQTKINHDDLVGKINLLRLHYIIDSWEGNLYFENEPEDSLLRLFRPIDEFSEEAHCGILLDGSTNKQHMYYHYYGEDELIDLNIDFTGYLDLALETRGFFYWQKYLLEFFYGKQSEESERFTHFMPLLFDNFSLDNFNKQLTSLAIDPSF